MGRSEAQVCDMALNTHDTKRTIIDDVHHHEFQDRFHAEPPVIFPCSTSSPGQHLSKKNQGTTGFLA
uniref:Uncharacterized protein n=1 Tax=Octopus bimaculoides TaxID=37653 RepID=A0A0L8FGM0_OCTBM